MLIHKNNNQTYHALIDGNTNSNEKEVNMTELRKGIPKGKTRVIGVDLFSHEDYIVKDCDTHDEAFQLADETNKKRAGSMDDVYYVYDDTGKHIRGEEAVKKLTSGRSVSP